MILVLGIIFGVCLIFVGSILIFFYTSCPTDTQMSVMAKSVLRSNPMLSRGILGSQPVTIKKPSSQQDPNMILLQLMLRPFIPFFNRLPTQSKVRTPNNLLKGTTRLEIRHHYIFKELVIVYPSDQNIELKIGIGVFGKCISL